MKKLFIGLINLYQKTPLHSHFYCRFYPTCSNYTKEVIESYGLFKGGVLSLKRIIRCNPFTKGGIDLPPKKKSKWDYKISHWPFYLFNENAILINSFISIFLFLFILFVKNAKYSIFPSPPLIGEYVRFFIKKPKSLK